MVSLNIDGQDLYFQVRVNNLQGLVHNINMEPFIQNTGGEVLLKALRYIILNHYKYYISHTFAVLRISQTPSTRKPKHDSSSLTNHVYTQAPSILILNVPPRNLDLHPFPLSTATVCSSLETWFFHSMFLEQVSVC